MIDVISVELMYVYASLASRTHEVVSSIGHDNQARRAMREVMLKLSDYG